MNLKPFCSPGINIALVQALYRMNIVTTRSPVITPPLYITITTIHNNMCMHVKCQMRVNHHETISFLKIQTVKYEVCLWKANRPLDCSRPITSHFQTEAQTASYPHSYGLSLLISSKPTGRGGQGGDVAAFASKHNIGVSVSNMSALICIRILLPSCCRIFFFLQPCQNYIINYRDTSEHCFWHDFVKEQSLWHGFHRG